MPAHSSAFPLLSRFAPLAVLQLDLGSVHSRRAETGQRSREVSFDDEQAACKLLLPINALIPTLFPMSEQLQISHVRNVLIRLEETIIFALIERTQFLRNTAIYEPARFGDVLEGESLVGFMLLECERSHAKVRRYTSPDEHPFFENLPEPILPALHLDSNPLEPNSININGTIRQVYEEEIVPHMCRTGDDDQYGSSAVCDVACLQALSKRIHYGKFVAESKFREARQDLLPSMQAGDGDGLMAAITDADVEEQVLDRVGAKARTYTRELASASMTPTVTPETIVEIYRSWIIPMNKQVQVDYLLQRGTT